MYVVLARREGKDFWEPPRGLPFYSIVFEEGELAMVSLSLVREAALASGVVYGEAKVFRLVEQDTFGWECKDKEVNDVS